ncbi:HEAT repeat domain-containing protein [Pinirhizobacter soli]|uniref:HEAT repeat domain-containing protein n=1 Tax=Pinirhizobacter soli TaxID=2786953 RepID=UPI002029D4E3|nr:HEAT repeat domain-containing protein [Pinirhizobacter soli]
MPLELDAFRQEADARIASDFHAGFLSLTESLSKFARRLDEIGGLAIDELNRVAQDPRAYSTAWEPNYLTLHRSREWTIRAGRYKRTSSFIYSSPFHMLICPITDHPLQVHHYELPNGINLDVFDSKARLKFKESRLYKCGDIIKVDGRLDAIDVTTSASAMVLKLTSRHFASQQWAFDRERLSAQQCIASEIVDSELVSLSGVLGAMRAHASIDVLKKLANHRRHFVRWSALQALAKISAAEASPLVAAAISDPHIHVRNAAKKALPRVLEAERA